VQSDWIEWAGGECPVADDVRVETKLRSGLTGVDRSQWWDWPHMASDRMNDIIAYRVVSL
jgi:hypothetical protein